MSSAIQTTYYVASHGHMHRGQIAALHMAPRTEPHRLISNTCHSSPGAGNSPLSVTPFPCCCPLCIGTEKTPEGKTKIDVGPNSTQFCVTLMEPSTRPKDFCEIKCKVEGKTSCSCIRSWCSASTKRRKLKKQQIMRAQEVCDACTHWNTHRPTFENRTQEKTSISCHRSISIHIATTGFISPL